MQIWKVLIISISCVGPALALLTAHMDQMCGEYVSTDERYRQVVFRYDSNRMTHRNCKVRITPGYLPYKYGLNPGRISDIGFLIVFQELNLMNLDCAKINVSVTQGVWQNQPGPPISGIPWTLCAGTIPWSEYPTPVIKAKGIAKLDIWFRAAPDTPSGTGFKLLIVDYYHTAYRCQDGEFRCDDDRCLTKEVENSDCDEIDWCMDNTGCGVNVGLIAGLCAFGALVLVSCIVSCIVCNAKKAAEPNDRFWGVGSPVTDTRYTRRNSPPAPYVEAARAAVARAATRNLATTAPVQPSAPLRSYSSLEQAQTMQRRQDRAPSPDREPPSYSSLLEPYNIPPQIGRPQPGDSASPQIELQQSRPVQHTVEEYQPPPPEYETTVEYPELYRVTGQEQTFV